MASEIMLLNSAVEYLCLFLVRYIFIYSFYFYSPMMLNKSCSEPNQISEDNQTSEVIVQQFNSLCIMFD